MDLMARLAQLDGNYFMCDYDDIRAVADAIQDIRGLSFSDRLIFCKAPVNARSTTVMGHLTRFAEQFAALENVHFNLRPRGVIRDEKDLSDLEDFHQVADLYLWLAFRLDRFVDREGARGGREEAAGMITQALESGIGAVSRRRGKVLRSERGEQVADTLRQYFASQNGVKMAKL